MSYPARINGDERYHVVNDWVFARTPCGREADRVIVVTDHPIVVECPECAPHAPAFWARIVDSRPPGVVKDS